MSPRRLVSIIEKSVLCVLHWTISAMSDQAHTKRPLSPPELLDLFKHWDTRVHHQEILFVIMSTTPIITVASAWEHVNNEVVAILAFGSLCAYSYYVLLIRRIAIFQDNIFHLLKESHFDNWSQIEANPNEFIGVRRLRLLGLQVLSFIWFSIIVVKTGVPCIQGMWYGILGATLVLPLLLTIWIWPDTPHKN